MTRPSIEELVSHIAPLVHASLFTLDDRLLFGGWTRRGYSWDGELAASRFGDVVQTVFAARGQLEGSEQLNQLTVESDESLVVIRPLSEAVAALFVFLPATPLGLARFHIARVLPSVGQLVVNIAPVGPPRSRRRPTEVPPAFQPSDAPRSSVPPPIPAPAVRSSPPPAPPAGSHSPAGTLVAESGAPSAVDTSRYARPKTEPPPPPTATPGSALPSTAEYGRTRQMVTHPLSASEPASAAPDTSDYGDAVESTTTETDSPVAQKGGGTEPPPSSSPESDGERSSTGTEPPPPPAPSDSVPAWAAAAEPVPKAPALPAMPAEPAPVPRPDRVEAAPQGDETVVTTRRDGTLPSGSAFGLDAAAVKAAVEAAAPAGAEPPSGTVFDEVTAVDSIRDETTGATLFDESAAAHASKELDPATSSGVELLEHLKRHAPDAHVVMDRVSLQTGLSLEALRAPDHLDDEDIRRVELAARRILGFIEGQLDG